MSKTETLRQSAAASNEKRIERLANQIEAVRQAKLTGVEELAAKLEPLAQAMAALTDETRRTLAAIERRSKEQGEKFQQQLKESTQSYRQAAEEAQKAASSLNRAGQRMEWRHYAIAALVGMTTAALVTGFWLWLAPPTINNQISLDAKAVAEHIKAATEQPKPSRSR